MQGQPVQAKGAVGILKYRVEIECEVTYDKGDGNTILGVSSTTYSTGARPKDSPTVEQLELIVRNSKALAELACFTVCEKGHQARNAMVVLPSKGPQSE